MIRVNASSRRLDRPTFCRCVNNNRRVKEARLSPDCQLKERERNGERWPIITNYLEMASVHADVVFLVWKPFTV